MLNPSFCKNLESSTHWNIYYILYDKKQHVILPFCWYYDNRSVLIDTYKHLFILYFLHALFRSCHKATMVIAGRAHCVIYMYILLLLLILLYIIMFSFFNITLFAPSLSLVFYFYCHIYVKSTDYETLQIL